MRVVKVYQREKFDPNENYDEYDDVENEKVISIFRDSSKRDKNQNSVKDLRHQINRQNNKNQEDV